MRKQSLDAKGSGWNPGFLTAITTPCSSGFTPAHSAMENQGPTLPSTCRAGTCGLDRVPRLQMLAGAGQTMERRMHTMMRKSYASEFWCLYIKFCWSAATRAADPRSGLLLRCVCGAKQMPKRRRGPKIFTIWLLTERACQPRGRRISLNKQ